MHQIPCAINPLNFVILYGMWQSSMAFVVGIVSKRRGGGHKHQRRSGAD